MDQTFCAGCVRQVMVVCDRRGRL